MIHTMLTIKVNSNEELRNYTERNMQATTRIFTVVKTSKLHKVVDDILKEKKENWLRNIINLLEQEKVCLIKSYSNELVVLDKICSISEKEIVSTGETILGKVSSLKELQEIYQETIFQFGRMELETENGYEEFKDIMRKWEFSIEYIKLILEKGAIYNKHNVARKLIEIFTEEGVAEYSKELQSFLN